jgi:hypothetical protein
MASFLPNAWFKCRQPLQLAEDKKGALGDAWAIRPRAADYIPDEGRLASRLPALAQPNRPKIAAVEVDPAGCSFNPDYEQHQQAIAISVAMEMQKQLDEELAQVVRFVIPLVATCWDFAQIMEADRFIQVMGPSGLSSVTGPLVSLLICHVWSQRVANLPCAVAMAVDCLRHIIVGGSPPCVLIDTNIARQPIDPCFVESFENHEQICLRSGRCKNFTETQ